MNVRKKIDKYLGILYALVSGSFLAEAGAPGAGERLAVRVAAAHVAVNLEHLVRPARALDHAELLDMGKSVLLTTFAQVVIIELS